MSGPSVFLSYARKDSAQVEQLYNSLKSAGFDPWLDKHDLVGGTVWRESLENAIRSSDFFLACVSTSSFGRRGVLQREIRLALDVWQEKLHDDVYLIPVRIDECMIPMPLAQFQWVDLFETDGEKSLFRALHEGMRRLGMSHSIVLRSNPSSDLTEDQVLILVQEMDFFDTTHNWNGKGIWHKYELLDMGGDQVIADEITGLMWQQCGLRDWQKCHHLGGALEYVEELNAEGFAGFKDWRLPTVDEAAGLLVPRKTSDGLFIDKLFDQTQTHIQTSDTCGGTWIGKPHQMLFDATGRIVNSPNAQIAWSVNFDTATISKSASRLTFVKAVRSGIGVKL